MSRNPMVSWIIFVVGLALGLIGYMTDAYSASVATILMLGVWIVVGGGLRAWERQQSQS